MSPTVMPYNTRRKSLSLTSLGIHVPETLAEKAERVAASRNLQNGSSHHRHGGQDHGQHRRPSPSSSSSSTPSSLSPASASASPSVPSPLSLNENQRQHPNKKMKRSHSGDDEPVRPVSVLRKEPRGDENRPPTAHRKPSVKFENTPPPSPKRRRVDSTEPPETEAVTPAPPKPIDLDAVNDDIVAAVIMQLQLTGNRPHLVKELAAILMLHLKIVQQSANPCAIISSRLATYLKRPCWSEASPCPLAKELETVHPRRTYFYLTTCPHLPLSETGQLVPGIPPFALAVPPQPSSLLQRSIITPSLSSGTTGSSSVDADEEEEQIRRRELSPSPEIDLSSPEIDDFDDDALPMPLTPIGSFSGRMSGGSLSSQRRPHHHQHHSRRGASPPLEKDEKEFTQTANVLQQKRKASGSNLLAAPMPNLGVSLATADGAVSSNMGSRDEGLFGGQTHRTFAPTSSQNHAFAMATSPAMRPTLDLGTLKKDVEAESWAKLDSMLEWDRSPENIELEELDCLLLDF